MSELLAREQHAEPVDKAQKWARDLLSLRYQDSTDHYFRETHNYALKRSFVAVSWTRQRSVRESSESGKYSVVAGEFCVQATKFRKQLQRMMVSENVKQNTKCIQDTGIP